MNLLHQLSFSSFLKLLIFSAFVFAKCGTAYVPNAENGGKLFEANCATCHNFKQDAIDGVTYMTVIGYDLFSIQMSDVYDYKPTSWVSSSEIIEQIHRDFKPDRKKLWGMLHAHTSTSARAN